MSKVLWHTPPSSVAIAVDSDDPNTTAPATNRIFEAATRPDQSLAYVLAVGGAATVQLWGYDPISKRWFKLGAATSCAQDTLTYLPVIPPLDFGLLYLQVTINSAATYLGVGLQGMR